MAIVRVTDFKDAEVILRIISQNNTLHYYLDFSFFGIITELHFSR